MSTPLAVTNMIGNTVAVFAIAKSENAFDRVKFEAFLTLPGVGSPGTPPDPIVEDNPVSRRATLDGRSAAHIKSVISFPPRREPRGQHSAGDHLQRRRAWIPCGKVHLQPTERR